MVKIVELMEQHVGETFSAMVTGATSYGLFVQLENTAEGMIRIEDLGREYFLFDSLRHRLIGVDSGREYRLGQQMAVMLARYYARSGVTTQGSLDFADAAGNAFVKLGCPLRFRLRGACAWYHSTHDYFHGTLHFTRGGRRTRFGLL